MVWDVFWSQTSHGSNCGKCCSCRKFVTCRRLQKRSIADILTPAAPRVPVKSGRSAGVQELQGILRRATIPIPPSLYVKHKSDSDLEQALEQLLSKHGLHRNADSRQVEKVKKKLQLSRDLEGMPLPTEAMRNTSRRFPLEHVFCPNSHICSVRLYAVFL